MENRFSVAEVLGLQQVKGDVGIEIEIEGKNPFPAVRDYWRSEHDGSLRGYSMEYVMRNPSNIKDVKKKVEYLKDKIDREGSKPVFSERAGVHAHVNVQHMTPNQVITMAMVYYCMETPLVRYCGENREGNHFCLRLQDADYVVDVLETTLRERNLRYLDSEDIRYASLNFCSLFKYGSIEFRAMETQPDFSKIVEWAEMLVRIRDYACKLESLSSIPFEISASGPTGWAKGILGEELFKLVNSPDFDMQVMRCMRPLQHLFYLKKD